MSITEQWLKDLLAMRPEDLGACDLYGDAASEAARYLILNWRDCWLDNYWENEPKGEVITKTMVEDIEETIKVLEAWKRDLLRKNLP